MSLADVMMPSVNKNPAARASSFPGVRIVIAIFFWVLGSRLAPVNRISRGSSTATKSLVDRDLPCSRRMISVGDMLSLVDNGCFLCGGLRWQSGTMIFWEWFVARCNLVSKIGFSVEIVFQWGGDFSLEFGVSLGKSKLLRASICVVVGTMQ